MAYDATQLKSVSGNVFGGIRFWTYESTDDGATVNTAGYISDGYTQGVRNGDWVFFVRRTSSSNTVPTEAKVFIVVSEGTASAPASDLADGQVMSTTDTD